MSTPGEHLDKIEKVAKELETDGHIISPEEFVKLEDLFFVIRDLRKSFEHELPPQENRR